MTGPILPVDTLPPFPPYFPLFRFLNSFRPHEERYSLVAFRVISGRRRGVVLLYLYNILCNAYSQNVKYFLRPRVVGLWHRVPIRTVLFAKRQRRQRRIPPPSHRRQYRKGIRLAIRLYCNIWKQPNDHRTVGGVSIRRRRSVSKGMCGQW